ncbi:hypothetical protein, partial [Paralcaligenes ginsengisoli]
TSTAGRAGLHSTAHPAASLQNYRPKYKVISSNLNERLKNNRLKHVQFCKHSNRKYAGKDLRLPP